MTIWDFLIIYLACGSPFAVHLLVTRNDSNSKYSTAIAIARLAAWPVFAVTIVFRWLTALAVTSSRGPGRAEQTALDRERSALENSEQISSGSVPLFEFRDAFHRYSSLSLESGVTTLAEGSSEIFEITMHPEPAIASACLYRKNRFRLLEHRDDARSDFLEMIERVAGENGARETILRSALATAAIVKDAEGVRTLRSALGIADDHVEFTPAPDTGVEIWNTAPHSQPNIS